MREAGLTTMTLIKPIKTETAGEDALELAEKLFQRAVAVMTSLIERIEGGYVPSEIEVKKAVTSLSSSANTTMKERRIVREQCKKSAEIVGDYAIDLDAAKFEIGRKLDLLRRA